MARGDGTERELDRYYETLEERLTAAELRRRYDMLLRSIERRAHTKTPDALSMGGQWTADLKSYIGCVETDPYLYVAAGANRAELADALHTVAPGLEFDIFVDELVGDPAFSGYPTVISYAGQIPAGQLAKMLRDVIPWGVVSLGELEAPIRA